MKNFKDKIYNKVGIKSDRTKNIAKHIGWSSFYKGASIIANFMLVPLTIDYLDAEKYGVWLTLTSFISWFGFFDIGLGNGLRNKFAEAKALGNHKDAQAYVSTAYFTIGAISIGIVLLFFCINPFINWSNFFNTSDGLAYDLNWLFPVIFAFFAIQLVVKLITNIYQADQNHSIQNKIQFLTQTISLLVIWLLTKAENSSLLLFGSIFSAIPVLVLLVLNFIGFNKRFKLFKPKWNLWQKKYFNEITNLGFKFFIIQIAAMVLFSTDNYIITRLFGPEEVVPYNIAFKYFSIVTIAYGILIAPFWSSFTEAYAKKEFEWIKKSVSNVQKIWLLVPMALIVMLFISNWFYNLWIGDKIQVSFNLSLAMACFVALQTFNMIYSVFLNGIGTLKIQIYTAFVSILINIPLSIILAINFNLGITGVILATCFSMTYSTMLKIIQYSKVINNRATGIWIK